MMFHLENHRCISGGNLRQTVGDGGTSVTKGACLLPVALDLLAAELVSGIGSR